MEMVLCNGPIILCLCVYVAVCTNGDDRNIMSESTNMMPVRLPNMSDMNRNDRMTMSVPMITGQPTYIRPLPPQQIESPVSSIIMAPNGPTSFFGYDMYKNHPQYRQHMCMSKVPYGPPDSTIPTLNTSPLIYKPPNDYDANYKNRILQIQVPPGLPPKTITKLDKLVNTINRSLLTICHENSRGFEDELIMDDGQHDESRNDKRWIVNDEPHEVSVEPTNEDENHEKLMDKINDKKWKRNASDDNEFHNRVCTLLEKFLY